MRRQGGIKHRIGNMLKSRSAKNQVTLVMAGALSGSGFAGLKKIIQPAGLSVGVLKNVVSDKAKVREAANLAGIRCLLEEGSAEADSYMLYNLKGITVGVLLFDAEQLSDKDQMKKDIDKTKHAGADFVLVYAAFDTKTDEKAAQVIAEAGADYVVGYGRKKVGPYSVILTDDQRKVPVLYGIGNLSRRQGAAMLWELRLSRNSQGQVQIEEEGYHPCLASGKIKPVAFALKEDQPKEEQIDFEEALFSVNAAVGIQERCRCYGIEDAALMRLMEGNHTAAQRTWEVQPVLTVEKKQNAYSRGKKGYEYKQSEGCYRRESDDAVREASIVCTGHIEYGRLLEADAACFGSFEFLKSFRAVASCFEGTDFVLGNLTAMAAPSYPSVGEVSQKTRVSGYANCRYEFVEALGKVGFTGLAMASGYNAGLGIEGIFETEKIIRDYRMIPSGIGRDKNPVVEINGIKVGFLSVTTECINGRNVLTGEAMSRFLNVFDEGRTRSEVQELREKGAEFIMAYLHCGMNKRLLPLEMRKSLAESMAKMGADYVICTGSREVSPYYRFETGDGRTVPIATSLGCFLTARTDEPFYHSAILKVFLRRDFDGTIKIDDNYIPIKIFEQHEGVQHAIMPAQTYFNKNYDKVVYGEVEEVVAKNLGSEIKRNCQRRIRINQDFAKNFTIAELYEFFGQKPKEKDLEQFGSKYHEPISFFTLKEDGLREGCVAILYDYINFGKTAKFTWDIQKCVDAGVSLVIDNKPHDELPCIVVDEPLMDVYERLANAVIHWYNPVKVVITGSMGKTTTKEMTVEVFQNHFKTLTNGGNANVIYQVGLMIQKLQDDDGAYVQEAHGGTIGMASAISKMMEPDICILTNIEKNHMTQVGTLENLIASKVGIIDGLKPNGVLIACKDNEFLRDINPPVRMIQYSVSDDSCHYYAKNIRTEGENLLFDIVVKESEFDHAGVYAASINMQGEHNVGNAVAVFAAGRQAGIPPHEIIAGLSRYRTKGIRQNIIEHNGIKMILDTHNSNPVALLAMFDVFDQFVPAKDGRKILVLGMMGEQGADSPKIHYETGKAICQHDFDLLFCFGEDAKYMAKAVKECGKESYYFNNREIFNKAIAENVRPGDVMMIKGSHSLELDTETMVPVYGTTIRQH